MIIVSAKYVTGGIEANFNGVTMFVKDEPGDKNRQLIAEAEAKGLVIQGAKK